MTQRDSSRVLCITWPAEAPLFEAFCANPKSAPIPEQNFKPIARSIAEHQGLLSKTFLPRVKTLGLSPVAASLQSSSQRRLIFVPFITVTDSTLSYRPVKSLGLAYTHFGKPVPLKSINK